MKTRNNNDDSSKVPSNPHDAFCALVTAMEWYEQQSAVLFNYTTVFAAKNECVQWYRKRDNVEDDERARSQKITKVRDVIRVTVDYVFQQ
ncbi:hypothetical protein TNCV_952841 [Trichonephila clavipes]|nr:hypothetical protein TNCV_952841 [Trichonephila clavipes]